MVKVNKYVIGDISYYLAIFNSLESKHSAAIHRYTTIEKFYSIEFLISFVFI